MRKLLRPKDILILTLAGAGDLLQEVKDPMNLVSSAYENMYGFIPQNYKRHNFWQVVQRSLKTNDLEIIIKDGKQYLRLTSEGKEKIKRDFPITNFLKKWNKKWVIVIFDIEENKRKIRNKLRNKLKSLGFGMLQQSVWLTPLPIGKDLLGYMEANGLSESVFVLEVSYMLLGDPKALARKIWNLDKLDEEAGKLKTKINDIINLITTGDGRLKKREGKISKSSLKISEKESEKRSRRRRELRRKRLELIVSLPLLPKELFPENIKGLL